MCKRNRLLTRCLSTVAVLAVGPLAFARTARDLAIERTVVQRGGKVDLRWDAAKMRIPGEPYLCIQRAGARLGTDELDVFPVRQHGWPKGAIACDTSEGTSQ